MKIQNGVRVALMVFVIDLLQNIIILSIYKVPFSFTLGFFLQIAMITIVLTLILKNMNLIKENGK